MAKQYLYQDIDALKKAGHLKDLPEYIEPNLNLNIALREYQVEAFKYFITYVESKLRKNKQIHTLFTYGDGIRQNGDYGRSDSLPVCAGVQEVFVLC